MNAFSANLGFPRIGANRELKIALERFWRGTSDASELIDRTSDIQDQIWRWQREAGIDLIPVGDFSLYDHVLDTIEMVGAVPLRYQQSPWTSNLERYFAMARGTSAHGGLAAMEMTKWFNTNYHYIVPEWSEEVDFALKPERLLQQIQLAQRQGFEPRPVVLGPVTLLQLGKVKSEHCSRDSVLEGLLPVYAELFRQLQQNQVQYVQLDEPCLSLDMDDSQREWLRRSCQELAAAAPEIDVTLTSYFDTLGQNLSFVLSLPVQTVHLDLVSASDQLDKALEQISDEKSLSLGLVNGRNVWRTDLDGAIRLGQRAVERLGKERVMVAPSCSLLHCPLDVEPEGKLQPEVKPWLAFARQKLREVAVISTALQDGVESVREELATQRQAISARRSSSRVVSQRVRQRLSALTPDMYARQSRFEVRSAQQRAQLDLPLLPTTTIGSFPQTADVRRARAQFRKQEIPEEEYQRFLEERTRECIRWQEEAGLDVLVHGEFERNDMVEYFGERLEGVTVTDNGWVQSYGSRCVKPPIIYGDVFRPAPMTVAWTKFAQEQTDKPMKGMLTGPVTILMWSFVRDDQPREETCRQIALAIRDEVTDLEANGIAVIQIDEPALREGLPLKRSDWQGYLTWAVECFRLASSSVADSTQIHTHMCYSEFNDILQSIVELDADVISIETSRSQMELLEGFGNFRYPNAIGPGVYDIHSPRVPDKSEMVALLQKACEAIPNERLWVNPDCGLKTRGWAEVRSALKVMVDAAQELRT